MTLVLPAVPLDPAGDRPHRFQPCAGVWLCTALFSLAAPSTGVAQADQPSPGSDEAYVLDVSQGPADASARLRAVVERYVERGAFEGTILVARGAEVLLADGWGVANREWGVPNDIDTRFRLGSLTKVFTGVLVMRLVQDGELDLSDPIGRYIPGLAEAVGDRVTVRHLLTHTYVLEPAEMRDSGVEQAGEIVERLASGYARADSGWRKGSYLNADILSAAGGVYSTAADLFRFSRALDGNVLLTPEARRRMLTPRVKEREDATDHRHYAFGWHIDRLQLEEDHAALEIVEHGGDVTSFETLFTRIPSLDALVVILYNHGETDQDAIRDDLIRVLVDSRGGADG